MSDSLIQFQKTLQDDSFEVMFEVLPIINEIHEKKEIIEALNSIDVQQKVIAKRVETLNTDIERLTNHADGIDYIIAVGCGLLCGTIDSLFVGEFDYEEALQKSKEKVNKYVESKAENLRTSETVNKAIENAKKKAAEKGKSLSKEEIEEIKRTVKEGVAKKFKKFVDMDNENGTVGALRRSIAKLEEHYKLPSDNAYKGIKGMNSASHHLDDLAHHPSILGLVAAIIGELFRAGIFIDKNGDWHLVWLGIDKMDKKRWLELVAPIIVAGLITWLLNVVNSKYKDEKDEKLPGPIRNIINALAKAPLAIAVLNSVRNVFTNWWGHLVSDMAGSKTSPGAGMGIPGLFLSILKEISSIPPLNFTSLPKVVDELYTKNRFDLRAELAVMNELGRQSIPILLGDIIVRTFYFVRHLISEFTKKNNYKDVNWRNVVPINNRTIVRMMSIESGVFTAFDITDAAIRSAIKNISPKNPKFWSDLILRVNFVGIGRFAIAISSDVKMGIQREHVVKERMFLHNKLLMLENAKISYLQEGMWLTAIDTANAIEQIKETVYKSVIFYIDKINRIDENWDILSSQIESIKENDSEFTRELLDMID